MAFFEREQIVHDEGEITMDTLRDFSKPRYDCAISQETSTDNASTWAVTAEAKPERL